MNPIPCKYFQQNRCHFGNRCRYQHIVPQCNNGLRLCLKHNIVQSNMTSTLTGISDCDQIICYYLNKYALTAIMMVDRYCYQFIKRCIHQQPFWKNQLEYRFRLLNPSAAALNASLFNNNVVNTLDYKKIVLYFDDTKSFAEKCQSLPRNYYMDSQLKQQIIRLLYDNDIDVLNPYKNVIRHKTVESAMLHDDDKITITFHNSEQWIQLFAEADCCSQSWFELLEQSLDCLYNQTIVSIDDTTTVDLSDDDQHECCQNHVIVITLKDAPPFEFVLRNSSNGYYDGSLAIHVLNTYTV